MKQNLILIATILFLFSCNNSKKEEYKNVGISNAVNKTTHPGKKLMETNCYVCHSPTASHDNRIAPPMVAIKKHYISKGTTKEEFKKEMQKWIENPSKEDAKMFGAVRRFGVMPKTPFPKETIEQIADYMFDNDIEQPEWFEEHFNEEKGNNQKSKEAKKRMQKQEVSIDNEELSYEERGLKYALSTKAELGKNLMGTIQKKGTLEAVEFCNIKAYPLTDSMSIVHSAKIKRVTDKPRNSNNAANATELKHIKTFKSIVANKEEPKPIIEEIENKIHFYYPITTNSMCLQCHGKPEKDIEPKTLKLLASLYTEDKALNYDTNQVRGIWSITFDK